jgi:hypothetical protein
MKKIMCIAALLMGIHDACFAMENLNNEILDQGNEYMIPAWLFSENEDNDTELMASASSVYSVDPNINCAIISSAVDYDLSGSEDEDEAYLNYSTGRRRSISRGSEERNFISQNVQMHRDMSVMQRFGLQCPNAVQVVVGASAIVFWTAILSTISNVDKE